AVVGQEQLARAFPAGTSDPAVVVADRASTDAVTSAAKLVPGVQTVRTHGRDAELVQLDVVLTADPGTPAALDQVRALRKAVHAVPGANAGVAGSDRATLDARTPAERDRLLLFPLILGIVLVVLLVLLRSV